MHNIIYIILLIVYPQFGKQSLLAPLIMSGVVRVLRCKSFKAEKRVSSSVMNAGFAGTCAAR